MSTPEIDWTNDEAVVRAALPPNSIIVADEQWVSMQGDKYWVYMRKNNPAVTRWEAKHKPQEPAVDVEKELYEALRAMVDAHADDWYDDVNYVKNARTAMKLYEAKGRL